MLYILNIWTQRVEMALKLSHSEIQKQDGLIEDINGLHVNEKLITEVLKANYVKS
jgi:hypothetical protein